MTRAERQRRWRQRQRAGEFIARIPVGHSVIEALIASDSIDECQALDKHEVELVLSAKLASWAKEWTA
jgi:hypothetical protein